MVTPPALSPITQRRFGSISVELRDSWSGNGFPNIVFEVLNAGANPADQRCRYHTAAHCQRINNKIAETGMPAWDKQLCDLNGTREDHEQDREPTTHSVVTQTKCKSCDQINRKMLQVMGCNGFRPQSGRHHR